MGKPLDIALIDVDSKIPNLALMKLSAYHKRHGDRVKFYEPLIDHPDLCYASKIFDFTPEPEYMPDCEIIRGVSRIRVPQSCPRKQSISCPTIRYTGVITRSEGLRGDALINALGVLFLVWMAMRLGRLPTLTSFGMGRK